MEGQRGTVGSMHESFNFDHGSSSSNATMDPQICWNNMRSQVEIGLPDYMLPGDRNGTFMNPVDLEQQNMNGWAIGEPSSRNTQQEPSEDERRVQSGWSSSVDAFVGTGECPRLEERRFEPTSVLSLDNINRSPVFMQSANSGMISQGLNLNETIVGHGDDSCLVTGSHNLYKSSRPGNEQLPPAGGSDPFFLHPGYGGFLVEDNEGRASSSLEGRRVSCKRKAVEGNVGQSSASGSGSYFQHAESGVWPPVAAQCNRGSSLSISAPSEQMNPVHGVGVRMISSDSQPDWARVGSAEACQRNFCARTNPSNHQEPILSTSFSTSNAVRRPSRSYSHQSRPLPMHHSMDFRSTAVIDDTNPQNQTPTVQVPVLPQNEQPFRWNGNSSSRTARSSNSSIPGDRDTVSREEAWTRNIPRHILEHPRFISAHAMRSLIHNPTHGNLTARNTSATGDVASTSRIGSSSGVHPPVAPSWVAHHNSPSRSSRRLSEYIRRSMFSSVGSEPGGLSSNHSSLFSGLPPSSSQDMTHQSGDGNPVHRQPYPMLASWTQSQGDNVLGFPHPLRALASGSEGRRRLASEQIRNVLDLMRRGEGLRFEDLMLLDQSMFFGLADIHDRHRDMRLDVDNMSYEELLALEERIGNVCTGLNEEAIVSRLKQGKYSHAGSVQTEVAEEPCCVCQEEYSDGEDVGTLECGHDFHRDCIKQWLMQKNICPICKTTGLST